MEKRIPAGLTILRRFGYLIGGLLVLWGAYRYSYVALGGIGILVVARVKPFVLKPFYYIWMTAALAAGWVMTRIILTVVFYGLVMSIGVMARLSGKNFLDLKIDRVRDSYWSYLGDRNGELDKSSCEKQY